MAGTLTPPQVPSGTGHDAGGRPSAWQRARAEWRDEPGRAFERRYLAQVDAAVRRALEAMAAMDRLNTQARRDCE